MNAARERGGEVTGEEMMRALGQAPGAIQSRKGTENIQIGAGGRALPALEQLERAQALATQNMSKFSDTLKLIGDNAVDLQKKLGPGFEKVAEWLEHLASKVQ